MVAISYTYTSTLLAIALVLLHRYPSAYADVNENMDFHDDMMKFVKNHLVCKDAGMEGVSLCKSGDSNNDNGYILFNSFYLRCNYQYSDLLKTSSSSASHDIELLIKQNNRDRTACIDINNSNLDSAGYILSKLSTIMPVCDDTVINAPKLPIGESRHGEDDCFTLPHYSFDDAVKLSIPSLDKDTPINNNIIMIDGDNSKSPDASSSSGTSFLGSPLAVIASVSCIAAFFATIVYMIQQKRTQQQQQQQQGQQESEIQHQHQHPLLTSTSGSQNHMMESSQSALSTSSKHREKSLKSMAQHPVIPFAAKVIVPILMVTIVALFITANAAIGARVGFSFRLLGKSLLDMDLFNFSLVNTITDMWDAKVYFLSLLVSVWSCAWVYTKAIMVAACWFLPPRLLALTHRRRMLLALDALGKYCMLDIFLMCMMSVAFKFHVTTNTMGILSKILPNDFVVVDVEVNPVYGLYGFMTAAALSLILNHMVLYFHRNTIGYDGVSDNPTHKDEILEERRAISPRRQSSDAFNFHEAAETTSKNLCCACPKGSWFDLGTVELFGTNDEKLAWERESVINHKFTERIPIICESSDKIAAFDAENPTSLVDDGTPLKIIVKIVATLFIFSTSILIFVFAYTDTFEFSFGGLAGAALSIVQPGAVTNSYSLIRIAESLADNEADPDQKFSPGIFYMQLCFLLFSIVLPFVTSIILCFVWLVPMTLRELKIAFYVSEVASAWAALDVYILSIIASVIEINQFSLFLQAPICDPIKKIIPEKYIPDHECFTVDTTLMPESFMLLGFAMFSWCVNQFITRLAERSIRDREASALSKQL